MNELLAQLLQSAAAAGDPLPQAQAEWTLAQMYQYLARLEDGQPHAERALALATAAGDAELAARCLNVLSYLYSGSYQAERARQASAEAGQRYADLGNPAMESDSLAQLACAHIRLGQPRPALAAGRRSQQRAEAVENHWGIANGQLQVAVALAELGELDPALQAVREAVALARDRQILFVAALGELTLAYMLRGLFQLDEAQSLLEGFIARQPPESIRVRAAVELCAVLAVRGDWAAARQALGQAGPLVAHPLFLAGRGLWLEAEALLRAGEPERAHEYVAEWGRVIRATPRASLDHARAVAVVHLFDGQPDLAVAALRPAAEAAASLDLPQELWQILAALARAQAAGGDAAGAQQAREQARGIVSSLGDSLADEAARQTFMIGANKQIEAAGRPD